MAVTVASEYPSSRIKSMKSHDASADPAQRQPAASLREHGPVSTGQREGAGRLDALQGAIERSPRMVAQRRDIDAAFGGAARREATVEDTSGVPIQRKVGLEFQTYAKLFNRKKQLPPYGHKVFELPGLFHVESDDGDVEFVTEPFDEDKNGLVGLMTAVGGMVTMARLMERTRTDTQEEDEPQAPQLIAVATAFGAGQFQSTYPDEDSELHVGDPQSTDEGPDMRAAPQATVGVRLDEIPRLFEWLAANDKVAHRLHGMESFLKPGTQSQAQIRLAGDLEVIAGSPTLGNENGALRGFITLILVYLRNAAVSKDAHREYVKIAHPVMARNSFTAMFDLLDEADQLQFLRAYPPEVLLAMSGTGRGLGDKLYPSDYKGEDDKVHASPTIRAWLASIARDDRLAKLPGNIVGRGMGGSNHMDEVAKDPKANVEPATAPVFELRRMLQNVEPEDWLGLAKLVHQLMNVLNGQKESTLSADDKRNINTEVNGYKDVANAERTDLNSDETELKYHR
jgi:hypothetical protein